MTLKPIPRQRTLTAPASTPSRPPAPINGRLDQHTAVAVARTIDSTGRTLLGAYHGLQILRLAEDTLGVSQLPDHGPNAVLGQHLLASLLTYQVALAPNDHWALTGLDVQQGALRWTCRSTEIPDVIDVFARSHRSAMPVAVQLDSATFIRVGVPDASLSIDALCRQRWAPVIRHCDGTDRRASTLTFPGEPPTAWCAADDPIISRELAWPHLDHPTLLFPSLGEVVHPNDWAATVGRSRTLQAPSRSTASVVDLASRRTSTRIGGIR